MTAAPKSDDPDIDAARRARLKALIARRSFADDKEVTLASGRKSWVYFNMKPTMLDPEGAHLLAAMILDAVKDANAHCVGGMELGGVPLVAMVAAASFDRPHPLQAIFIRKKVKDHGSRQRIEGLAPFESLKGKAVVMLEDVTTTGASILDAVAELRATGAEIARVVTVVDREEGARQALAAQNIELVALFTAAEFTAKK